FGCGDYIIHEIGGHCFFDAKRYVNPVTIRFYIKKKVVYLTLPLFVRGKNKLKITRGGGYFPWGVSRFLTRRII
ncbi:MAG: hypothetical protein PHG16_00625, partial [Lachnospiraceae bacterium]|nr:hypothetical protein [Lachnospiraceae bacterium]